MNRLIGIMAASLVLGACGMWAATHLKVSVDNGATPPATHAEPARLPASLFVAAPPDARVMLASALVDTPATVMVPVLSAKDGAVTWDGAILTNEVKLIGDALTLNFTTIASANEVKVEVVAGNKTSTIKPTGTLDAVTFTLEDTNANRGEPAEVTVTRTIPAPMMPGAVAINHVSKIKLVRPLPAQPSPGFFIDSQASTPGLDFTAAAPTLEPVGTYLRLKGRAPATMTRAPVFSLIHGGKIVAPVVVKTFTAKDADWECELTFPERAATETANLLARADLGSGHAYAELIPVEFKTRKPSQLSAPTITLVKAAVAGESIKVAATNEPRFQVVGLTTYLANTRALTANVAADPAAKAVALYLDDRLVGTKPATGATPVPFEIKDVGPGLQHNFRAVSAAGDFNGTQSIVALRVQTVGPAVESVSAPGFGQSNGVGGEKIAIRFGGDNPLAAASLNGKFELKLIGASSEGSNLVAGDGLLDPTTNTVTITVTGIVPGSYILRVMPGIKDVYGNEMAKIPGTTGSAAFDAKLFTQQVAAPPASVVPAGVTLQSGPNVEFQEYTRFRKLVDGFNPSDRVETRVIRLYYNRDAHRVAQIVNRDVKSYNAVGVDVRRRAADRSRDDANKLTDERKRQEDIAVQAAKDARTAEALLRDLQSRQVTARTEAATAKSQLSQRQQQLDDALRNLGRARTDIDTRRAIDPSTDVASRRVAELESEIVRLKSTITEASYTTVPTQLTIDADTVAARQTVTDRQTDLTVATANVRKEVEADPTVIAADQKVKNAQAKVSAPGLTPAALEQLQTELAKRQVDHDFAYQVAFTNAPSKVKYDTALVNYRTAVANAVKKERAQEAVKQLTAKQFELTDAQNAARRTSAVAAGRGANDAGADPSQDLVGGLQAEIAKLNAASNAATSRDQSLQAEIAAAQGDVQAKRTREIEATQRARQLDQQELRGRESQFRSEVAAAKEDPDTYAPGLPDSLDPVRQCSISVIGEGLIQIRGPIKGLNIVRTMVNQMDMPIGQVRVGVHTIQINGERADRMDRVVQNIQRYLDHSRFLTAQSSQMLRKAVTVVASRKADEIAATLPPGCSQADRDQKYLHSFFGKDFIDELTVMDSEFLKTGNKILSLHSMDSTSLSSALFLMSLAKNNIRAEILYEFQCQLQTKLPQAEWNFYAAGLTCPNRCEAHCDRKFCVLAGNAKFESFLGYFNAEVQGDDTLNPLQREFVRLAQIFKARLVTELELKQRVMERSILEDRVGNYLEDLANAKAREDEANKKFFELQQQVTKASSQALQALAQLDGPLQLIRDIETRFSADWKTATELKRVKVTMPPPYGGRRSLENVPLAPEDSDKPRVQQLFKRSDKEGYSEEGDVDLRSSMTNIRNIMSFLGQFSFLGGGNEKKYLSLSKQVQRLDTGNPIDQFLTTAEYTVLRDDILFLLTLVRKETETANTQLRSITGALGANTANLFEAIGSFKTLRSEYLAKLRDSNTPGSFKPGVTSAFDLAETAFNELGQLSAASQAASLNARNARRRLDEKKLLDMLVDELEDKFIELVDGTRAHTANVDNYLKGLATALDDDFNTQFYQPAFSKIRMLGVSWDVQLGQIESTTVLTNNRTLAKVSPAASMEFDLPQRSIFIKEAFKGAKAAVDEYGALLSDPTFLTVARMYSGVPPAATFGLPGGLPSVRNVLPGQASSADELLMTQAGNNRKEFGSALETLIPDPAVYKFETGTGYEIRPVMNPDGQAVVFGFDYMYTSDVREPLRADEKHLGKVKRHFVHTDVQLSNFEMREVSKYWVTLKASRTSQGVQLLQDIPGVGALFRPAPSSQSSLQQNMIYAQTTLYPTLFDLMGLRYAPAVADVDSTFLKTEEFVVRNRREFLRGHIFDYGASRVDDALRIMYGERRPDLYRTHQTIPWVHPNGYQGPGLRQRDSELREGYQPNDLYPPSKFYQGRPVGAGGLPGDPNQPGGMIEYPVGPSTFPPAPVGYDGAKIPPPPGVPGAPARNPTPAMTIGRPTGTTITPTTPPKAPVPFTPPPAMPTPTPFSPPYTAPTPSPLPSR